MNARCACRCRRVVVVVVGISLLPDWRKIWNDGCADGASVRAKRSERAKKPKYIVHKLSDLILCFVNTFTVRFVGEFHFVLPFCCSLFHLRTKTLHFSFLGEIYVNFRWCTKQTKAKLKLRNEKFEKSERERVCNWFSGRNSHGDLWTHMDAYECHCELSWKTPTHRVMWTVCTVTTASHAVPLKL